MKKLIYIFGMAGVISLAACDNANRGIRSNQEADNNMMDQGDTSAIQEGFNTRGVPTEGIPDNNAVRSDTLDTNDDNNRIMNSLPEAVRKEIMEDASLHTLRVTDSREYSEGGTTYYELSFDNGTKVTFDAQGKKSPEK